MSKVFMKAETARHAWPWAADVTWTAVLLIVGILLVLASAYVPA
jgi:uncharacterized membrane protein